MKTLDFIIGFAFGALLTYIFMKFIFGTFEGGFKFPFPFADNKASEQSNIKIKHEVVK